MSLRKSNLELCRIVCMILIIMHHSIIHGGIWGIENCTNKFLGLWFFPGGKICFDAFIVLSVWFLVDQNFKIEHFFKTWIQVLIYSIIFSILAIKLGGGEHSFWR